MKLSIEIEDDKLGNMIQAQVGAAIAKMTDDAIKSRIEDILSVKFARVTDAAIDGVLMKAAELQVSAVVNRGYNNAVIREALATAAAKAIKEARL